MASDQPPLTIELSAQASLSKRAKDTLRQLFGGHVYALLAQTRSGLFAVDPEDFGVSRDLLLNGDYHRSEIDSLCAYINADSSVLVVGAHIGAFAVPLARACKQLIAIEPNPRSYELLKINLVLNEIANCQILNIAANDRGESLKFVQSRVNSGGAKREPRVKDNMYYYDNPETIVVKGARLDDLLVDVTFDLIVMDIEGSEFFALQGMQNILKRANVLDVEFLPHHLRYVSQVTVSQFVELIEPHFDKLYVPSKTLSVDRDQFKTVLQGMYDKDERDEGVIFSKRPLAN